MMKFIYGRYDFSKLDRAKNCTKVYAAFMSEKLAKGYGKMMMYDITPPNTVDFIYDGEALLFASKKNNTHSWEKLEDTVVYDCSDDKEVWLKDCWISEKDIIRAIIEILN